MVKVSTRGLVSEQKVSKQMLGADEYFRVVDLLHASLWSLLGSEFCVFIPLLVMIRLLYRFPPHILSCTRGSCRIRPSFLPHSSGEQSAQQICRGRVAPQLSALVRYSDVSTQKFSVIYSLPHIKLLRAVSRLKLLQTAVTVVILPPVYVLYFQGAASFFLVGYSTGIAVFAAVMLYTASHFLRRVVGMMYLDPSHTTLKVSHLTFWGKRQDTYMPVSDVMTIWDAGESGNETILKLKRFSGRDTFYFSTHFGRVMDKPAFEKVFGGSK